MTENFTAMNENLLKSLRKENPEVHITLKKNQFHIFGDISRGKLILPKGFFKGPQVGRNHHASLHLPPSARSLPA